MYNKNFISLLSSIVLASSLLGDSKNGKELFLDAKCLSCHETTSFKHREDKVNSFPMLKKKVRMCEYNTGTGWFDEEVDDVTEYLNQTYYHY